MATTATTPQDSPSGDGGHEPADDVMHLVGPPMWETLHYTAFQCPEPFAERAPALVGLVRGYVLLLPCAECRGHFAALLDAHPPEIAAQSGRQAFARWTVDAHNAVNARLGKPLVTYEQAVWRYGRGDLRCRDPGAGPHVRRAALPPAAVGALVIVLAAVALAGVWLYVRARADDARTRAPSNEAPSSPSLTPSDTGATRPKWPRWGPTGV